MKKLIYIIAVLVLIVAGYYLYMYWALGNDSVAQPIESQNPVGENMEGEADPSRMTLTMTDWRWQRAVYNDGREVVPTKPETFVLTFKKDGTFSATTDCNSVGGEYSASEGEISFTNIMSTLMYCEGSLESEFTQILSNTSGYSFTSRGELILDLKFDSGSAVFR